MELIAYHGSFSEPFEKFDYTFNGKATGIKSPYFFFTSSKENAIGFADEDVGHLITARLSFSNPFIVIGFTDKNPRQIADGILWSNFQNDCDYDGVIVKNCVDSRYGIQSDIFVAFNADSIEIIKRTNFTNEGLNYGN